MKICFSQGIILSVFALLSILPGSSATTVQECVNAGYQKCLNKYKGCEPSSSDCGQTCADASVCESNCCQDGYCVVIQYCPGVEPRKSTSESTTESSSNTGLILGIAIPGGIILVILCFMCMNKIRKQEILEARAKHAAAATQMGVQFNGGMALQNTNTPIGQAQMFQHPGQVNPQPMYDNNALPAGNNYLGYNNNSNMMMNPNQNQQIQPNQGNIQYM